MVNRVVGRVLCRETGAGVRDLIVTVIDIDQFTPVSSGFSAASSPDTHVVKTDPRAAIFDAAGDRLGSVLTDRTGWFELEFTDDLYTTGKQSEGRPDLALVVLAPDRPRSEENPYGLDFAERVLYATPLPRFEAGRIESYVIHLEERRLQAAGVYRARQTHAMLSPEHYQKALSLQAEHRAGIKAARAGAVQARQPLLVAERAAVKKILTGLTGKSGLFPSAGYIDFDFRKSEILKFVHNRLNTLLNRLGGTPVSIRARLTDEDIRQLGGDPAALARGEKLHVTFCDLSHQLGSEGALTRSRDLLTEITARRAVRALQAEPAAPAPVEPPDGGGDPGGTNAKEEVRRAVLDRLAAQIAQLPAYQGLESGGAANELGRIKETVRQLELAGGPANVVAAHDVNVLQIAFESTWTTFFDRRFEKRVRELYRNVAKIREDYGLDIDEVESASTAQELRRLLADITGSAEYAALDPLPQEILRAFPWMTRELWARLDDEGKEALLNLAEEEEEKGEESASARAVAPRRRARSGRVAVAAAPGMPTENGASISETVPDGIGAQARTILTRHLRSPIATVEALVADLEQRLAEPYSFDVFVPGTVNYGVLLTYRQLWSPVTYQVGRLVETLPLAPGETREFTVKQTRKLTERERRKESMLRESAAESQRTSRTEMEALDAVQQAINNKLSSEGSFNIGIGKIGASSEFSQNFTQESRRLQKSFAEIARKAADKEKRELEVSVETEGERLFESTAKHTISNPNNEITVTYLLYELERRFQVTSRLQRVQPVILVALDMPMPDEITESWLIEHSWILRETLLDPSLERALDYLEEGRLGDALDLELRRSAYLTQKEITAELEAEYHRLADQALARRDEIVRLMEGEGEAAAGEMDTGERIAAAIFTGGLSELFGVGRTSENELLESQRKAAERALEYLEAQLEAKGKALSDAQAALERATERLSEAVKLKAERDTAIKQLQLHVRQYIYHYMHQIWMREHPDQRFFSLYDKEVPFFDPDPSAYALRQARPEELEEEIPGVRRSGDLYVLEFAPPMPPGSMEEIPKRKLGDIADLDRPLGFRGNYVIFPLRTCSQLTDVMLHAFFDDYFGTRDPAYGRPYTGQELLEYAREVWNDPEVGLTDAEKARLADAIVEAMLRFPDAVQEVVLPTGKLFMEALKGDQTLLEPFKLAHRGLDVLKVEEEVRAARVETLRRAARIAGDQLDLDPAEVEKFVVVKSEASPVIDV